MVNYTINMNFRKNVITKKSFKIYNDILRNFSNECRHSNSNNSVICNSFPKSGTFLLFNILNMIDNLEDKGNFIAQHPSRKKNPIQNGLIKKKLERLFKNELIASHIFFSEEIREFIVDRKLVNYFIYRDPRDVVISESFYLSDMNKWHLLHKYFRKLESLEDKINLSILGNDFLLTNVNYLNIAQRFNLYKGWLSCSNTFSVKYEDLIGNAKDKFINKILHFYFLNTNSTVIEEIFKPSASYEVHFSKSHTFREGGSNKWKKYFSKSNKENFKKVAGDLLIELGYEKDYNW